jgi:predicted membrane protein
VISRVSGKTMLYLSNFASLLLVLQVLVMRFNVVVGGQYISKSDRGFAEFHFELFAKEGVVIAAIILAAPFIVYYILSKFIPIFDNDMKTSEG